MGPLRELTDVLGSLVHRLEQTTQTFPEGFITGAATKSPRLLEIRLGETTDRALLRWRAFFDFFRRTNPEEEIGQRETSRILHALFLRAGFAEVHLLHLAFQNLGQKNARVITFANVAQHLSV